MPSESTTVVLSTDRATTTVVLDATTVVSATPGTATTVIVGPVSGPPGRDGVGGGGGTVDQGDIDAAVAAEAALRSTADGTLTTAIAGKEATGVATAAVATHAAAVDPHGDRAYAAGIVASEATARSSADALKANAADLATVASSGAYADLSGKPTIPTTAVEVGADPAGTAAGLVATETTARTTADSVISSSVTAEATARASADSTETTARIAADALKAPLASPTFTGTVAGITAAMVGADASGTAAGLVATEASTRASADTTNATAITSEATTARAAESANATAIAAKAPLASPTFTGTVAGITATMVGAQPLDSDLSAIAALTTTTYGRAVLAFADAAALRTAAALGGASTLNVGTTAGTVAAGDRTYPGPLATSVGQQTINAVATTTPSLLDSNPPITAAVGEVLEIEGAIVYVNNSGGTRTFLPRLVVGASTINADTGSGNFLTATTVRCPFRLVLSVESTALVRYALSGIVNTIPLVGVGTITDNLTTGQTLQVVGVTNATTATQSMQVQFLAVKRLRTTLT